MVSKRLLLGFVFGICLISFLLFVFATATTLFTLVDFGNYSGSILLTCNTTVNSSTSDYNVTFYYNASGGATQNGSITNNFSAPIVNSSAEQKFFNVTINTALFSDSLYYNITCFADNGTDQQASAAIVNVTLDNTAPYANISGTATVVNYGNYSNNTWLQINSSATDATIGMDSVYFNITNSSGVQVNFSQASRQGTGVYYNLTLNSTDFSDGNYTVTLFANDSHLNNLNNSEWIIFTIDNTNPTASFSCSPSSVYLGETVTCSCVPVDSGSGINSALTIFTATPSTDNAGTFTQNCTFSDLLGHNGSMSATYTVSRNPATTSPAGGSSASTWKNTYTYSDAEFSEKESLTRELSNKYRVKLKINNEYHYVGVASLTSTQATIIVSSTPQEAVFNIGDEEKFDVDGDRYYDVLVKLNSIANNKAEVTISSIHEEVVVTESSGEDGLGESLEEGKENVGEFVGNNKSLSIGIVVAIIIVILILLGYFGFRKSKKR